MDELRTVDERAEDERAEDELEVQEAGSTFVLGAEGWETSEFVDPDDDWSLLSDGSYLSPEGNV
ncbi:MAG: hypothetical protein IMZ75_10225 [Actinobacteria bacterium]|nr:hypothetical protein [Actinomycetota bacterium]